MSLFTIERPKKDLRQIFSPTIAAVTMPRTTDQKMAFEAKFHISSLWHSNLLIRSYNSETFPLINPNPSLYTPGRWMDVVDHVMAERSFPETHYTRATDSKKERPKVNEKYVSLTRQEYNSRCRPLWYCTHPSNMVSPSIHRQLLRQLTYKYF